MRHFWFPGFWALSILFLCTLGTEDLPSVGFLDFLSFDKLAHTFMFGVLALSCLVAFRRQSVSATLRRRALVAAAMGSFGFGIAIELLQFLLSTGRSAEFQDMLANTLGCVLGIYFFRFVYGKKLFRAS